MHLKLVGLGQHGHRSGRGVHTSLRLSGWYALHAVNARLVLQCAIDVGTAHGEVDLLITAHGTLADAGDGELPAFRVAEALVHLKEVAGKEACLVASRSGTDLHLNVLGVLGVFRYQCNLDFFLQLRLQGLVRGQLLACHLLHLGVVLAHQDVLGFANAVQTVDIAATGVHDVTQILVFFRQFDETLLVGYHVGVSNQC